MTKIKNRLSDFLNGIYYPVSVAIFVYIGHTFSIEELALFYIISSLLIGSVICNDMKFIISPLFYFFFMVSRKSILDDRFYSTGYSIGIILTSVIIVSFLVYHFIKYKENVDFSKFTKSKLFPAYIALSVIFIFNGFFDFSEYHFVNFLFAIVLIASFVIPFFIFSVNLKPSYELRKYIVWVFYIMSVLIMLQLLTLFIKDRSSIIVNGSIVKNAITLGWGIFNNIGFILAMTIPVHFYLAVTEKNGWIFYITAVITALFVVLTLSRASILTAFILFSTCAVASCIIKNKNTKTNRIISVSLIAVAILGFIILREKIFGLFSDIIQRGFDDNGRFDMYKHGLANYANHPIFGAGFSNSYKNIDHPIFDSGVIENQIQSAESFYERTDMPSLLFIPPVYHNTFIQILATCGTFGIVGYLYHRYKTVRLAIEKKSVFTFFMSMMIVGLLFATLLDVHMFNIYPAFYYSTILFAIETMGSDDLKV